MNGINLSSRDIFSYLGIAINSLVDKGEFISIDDLTERIEHETLWSLLDEKTDCKTVLHNQSQRKEFSDYFQANVCAHKQYYEINNGYSLLAILLFDAISSNGDDFFKSLDKKHIKHNIFSTLITIEEFYDFLSNNDSGNTSLYVKGVINMDALIFASIKGTIESIKYLLEMGHINDAFALIRKYEDATVTNIYKTLLIEEENDKFSDSLNGDAIYILYENPVNKWAQGAPITNLKAELHKIGQNKKVKDLTNILGVKTKKKEPNSSDRKLCNNNVHYNALKYFIWNDIKLIKFEDRSKLLDKAEKAILNIFTTHFSYVFVLNPEYLGSSDYIDALDAGIKPENGSQEWVAPIAQDIFDKYISTINPVLADYLRKCNFLDLK